VKNIFIIATAVVALTTGCKGKKSEGGNVGGAAKGANVMQAKLAGYIECLNRHGSRIDQLAGIYFNSFEGDVPTEKSKPDVSEAFEIGDCIKSIAAAKAHEPSVPALDAAGEAFSKALSDVAPLLKEAHDYYERGNNKDDKGAKGIALHPKLVAAFDAFDKANSALSEQVNVLNRKARAEDLAAREKVNGRKLDVVQDSMMAKAEEAVSFAHASAQHLDKIDLPALTAAVDALEKSIDELDKYSTSHAEETAKVSNVYSMFVNEAQAYLTSAKELMRRVRDKTPFSSGEKMTMESNEKSVNGTPGNMLDLYNRLVDSYNRL
jgi:hypothetical protein